MSYVYEGSELDLFSAATNWKSYFSQILSPHISGRVLEVGAGIGSNIPYLHNPAVREWVSLEPDPALASRISQQIASGRLPKDCRVIAGTLAEIERAPVYDSILYIDVLEHIADDAGELARATERLAPQGRIVVLSPAHQFLFSPFDASVGHCRRYNARTLTAVRPPGCRLVACRMLDSFGFFASLSNLFLRASTPSRGQIAFWDKFLVPVSRHLDGLTAFKFGKTIIAVWSLSG